MRNVRKNLKMDKYYCTVGIGEVLWDLLTNGKQLGGAPSNFAYYAQELGACSYIVSAVGDDELGRELLKKLKRNNMNQEFIAIDNQHLTGTVSVKLDLEGVPDFTIHENVAWDYIPFLPKMKNLASRTHAVCFGTLVQRSEVSHSTLRSFLQLTPPNCLRIFDVNLRQSYFNREIILESLKFANVIKLNDEELQVIADMYSIAGTETEVLLKLTKQFDLKIAAITKGKNGSRLFSLDKNSFLNSPAVQVVDTVGAGDAFTAALAVGMLQGLSIETIHRNAARLSAYVCTQKGATPKLSEELKLELLKSR